MATRIGDPAWEVRQGSEAYSAIYTDCFLEAFRNPYPNMVLPNVNGVRVVPNRRLKGYLHDEVAKKSQGSSVKINQIPDADVCSDEPTYIGRVIGADRSDAAPPPSPTLPDVASTAIATRVAGGTPDIGKATGSAALAALAASSGFNAARDSVANARGVEEQLALRNGFAVVGQRLRRVVTGPEVKAQFANAGSGVRPFASVEATFGPRTAASALLEFEDGTGTVLPLLSEYVGTVTVSDGRVTNVSFTPSRRGPMWSEYEREAKQLERLRADVAAAARLGVLRFEGPKAERDRAARSLADRIRVLKGIDPTLGLYAAYAYFDAGVKDQIESVEHYVRENLQADLFDIAMLSGALRAGQARGPYPLCPMLSQGWGLLRVLGVKLPESMLAARDHLIPSLWTTLDKDGVAIAAAAVSNSR